MLFLIILEKDYFSMFADSVETTKESTEDFNYTLKSESKEMELALAGSSSSSGLIGVDISKDIEEKYQIVRFLLRDTLVSGYRHGLANGKATGISILSIYKLSH